MFDIVEPTDEQLTSLLLYGLPKTGKSTILANLTINETNSLVISTDPKGYHFLKARVKQVDDYKEFNKLLEELADSKLKYLIIDTVTQLDIWSEIVGTYVYMKSVQGKSFNRDGKGNPILYGDDGFTSVYNLANGAGYQYSREVMMEWFRKFQKIAERVILVAHVKDKRVESKLQDIVDVADINLTGKVKSIWSSVVDGIGFVYRDKTECYISFEAKQDVIAGCRLARLSNQNVMISDGKTVNWDKIYSDIKIK